MPRLRFGIAGLMMLTLVAAVAASAGYHFYLAAHGGGRAHQLVGIVIAVAGPVLLVVVFSAFHALTRWLQRRR